MDQTQALDREISPHVQDHTALLMCVGLISASEGLFRQVLRVSLELGTMRRWKNGLAPRPKPMARMRKNKRRPSREAKTQYGFTDPKSRIRKSPAGFVHGYNAQIAVEPALQLIIGQAVTQQANDKSNCCR